VENSPSASPAAKAMPEVPTTHTPKRSLDTLARAGMKSAFFPSSIDLNRSCASATNARTRSAAGKWPVDTGEKVVSIATYSLGRRHLCTPTANSEPRLTKRHRKTYSIWPNFVTIKSTVIRPRAGFDIGILVPWLFQCIENAALVVLEAFRKKSSGRPTLAKGPQPRRSWSAVHHNCWRVIKD